MTRVLVVDDHALVRRGVRQLLGDELSHLTIEESATVEAALERIEGAPFDLVIVDLNLPGRQGLAILEALRGRPAAPPILVLSVYPEGEFALRCLRLGAAGYLSKDGAAEELVTAVRRVLAGGRYVTASLAERLAGLLSGPPSGAAAASPLDVLSERELEVLRLVAAGLTLKEIAGRLGLSEKTVASYRARLSEKLQLPSAVDLTRFAARHHLLD
jgi:DNA-binding NarL/FixJ family response regulator